MGIEQMSGRSGGYHPDGDPNAAENVRKQNEAMYKGGLPKVREQIAAEKAGKTVPGLSGSEVSPAERAREQREGNIEAKYLRVGAKLYMDLGLGSKISSREVGLALQGGRGVQYFLDTYKPEWSINDPRLRGLKRIAEEAGIAEEIGFKNEEREGEGEQEEKVERVQ